MKCQPVYLGVDLGSVSTNLVLLNAERLDVVEKVYLRTQGQPIRTLQKAVEEIARRGIWRIVGVGTTGSARQLAGDLGADGKIEITAHTIAALYVNKDVQTVIEISGQDSKIIIIRDGVASDFAMNTVCAGTGLVSGSAGITPWHSDPGFWWNGPAKPNPVRIAAGALFSPSQI